MAAFDYAEMQTDAAELITEFGQSGFLRPYAVTGSVPYNPTKQQQPDVSATFAVLNYDAREIDGSRILATDKKVILSASGLEEAPSTKHRLVLSDGETDYAIVDVQPIAPGETVVAYLVQARR